MSLAKYFAICFVVKFLDLSLSNSEVQNFSNTTQPYTNNVQLQDVLSILNDNGYLNPIFLTLDFNDTEVYDFMVSLSNNSNGAYTFPITTGTLPRNCYSDKCFYRHWFVNEPTMPITYMIRNDIERDAKNTMVLIMSSFNLSHWKYYLNEIVSRKILSCIVIMTKSMSTTDRKSFVTQLDELGKNSMFYWVHSMENQILNDTFWYRVITINGQTRAIINQLQFRNRTRIKEEYDLQGIHLLSMSLSWNPYFLLFDCNDQGKQCKSEGYLKNLMDGLGTLMNFTWESHKEVNNDWGIVPNANGDWVGVEGNVLNGTYQLSIRQD